jgi:hypothetical protein
MESQQSGLPGPLEVVLKNVCAVREVYDYIKSGAINGDLISFRQTLLTHLRQSLQMPDDWGRPNLGKKDEILMRPNTKWMVGGKDGIAISILLPSPTADEEEDDEDRDASVNLYVPSWKPRERFTTSLRSILPKSENWVFLGDDPEGIDPGYPMGKWIRYADYATSSGFDTARFFEEITQTVNEFLRLEVEIDRLIEEAKRASTASPSKRPVGQPRRPRKRR